MQINEAEARLKAMLSEAGFDLANPLPSVAWPILKAFYREPVECAHNGFLFECGVYNFFGKDEFRFSFTRQFIVDAEGGEYDHMEHLRCVFTCPPEPELDSLRTSLWAERFKSLDQFYEAVENLKEFHGAIHRTGWDSKVQQNEV